MPHDMPDGRSASAIPRREFLSYTAGTAGVLAPAILRSDVLDKLLAEGGGPSHDMRIGYVEGSESIDPATLAHAVAEETLNVDEDAPSSKTLSIVDARRMSSGDPEFASRGVRITIHGMHLAHGATKAETKPIAAYVHNRPFGSTPFEAWSFRGDEAKPVRFDLPVAEKDGLLVSWAIGHQPEGLTPLDEAFYENQLATRFAIGRERGTPKLRRGLYLVAWSGSLPAWESYGLEIELPESESEEAIPVSSSKLVAGLTSAQRPFAYALLSVEYDEIV